MAHRLTLDGLRLEPLASYMAALGVLRLVAEQADPDAKGWWQNERFHLHSKLDATALVRFFLQDYRPTPMANPWNADGGFFGRSSYSGITRIEQSDDPRFADYRAALTVFRDTLKSHNLEQKPKTPAAKLALLRSLHNDLTPSARRYLDTVLTLNDGDVTYHALFFSGGNSGKVDLARTFMDRLARLLLPSPRQRRPGPRESESLLRSALFDTITDQLEPSTGGPYDPGSSAGVNASSSGYDVDAFCNPWTYVLGMEGTLTLWGGSGEMAHSSVGYTSAVAEESKMPDLRLPVCSVPQTLEQLQQQLAGKALHHDLRYSFFPRNGRSHFAVPVERRPEATNKRPAFITRLERQLKEPISRELQLTLGEEPPSAGRILEALGALSGDYETLPTLSHGWISAANDGTAEFGCALALSGLGKGLDNEHLKVGRQLPHFVGQDLCARMLSLLRLRARWAHKVLKTPTRGGYPRFNAPFWSTHPIRATHLEAFLFGGLNEARIEHLFRGLCLVRDSLMDEPAHERAFLPYAFSMAQLAFHQNRDRRPAPVEVAEALAANRVNCAVALAARFLAHRHPGFPQDWPPCPPLDTSTCQRWAAALLFPISDTSYRAILGDLHA